jgi:hypothetical protein
MTVGHAGASQPIPEEIESPDYEQMIIWDTNYGWHSKVDELYGCESDERNREYRVEKVRHASRGPASHWFAMLSHHKTPQEDGIRDRGERRASHHD